MRLKRSLTLLAGMVGTTLTAGVLMAGPALAAPASHPGAPSAHSATSPVPHRDGPTFTNLSLSSRSIAFGQEGSEVITASVSCSGQSCSSPTGLVTIFAGQTEVCHFTQLFVSGHCSPDDSQLAPGTYTLTAFYQGDGRNNPSSSGPVTLTVTEGPTITTMGVSPNTGAFGQESAVDLTVAVAPAGGSVTPTGSFVVLANGNPVCSGTLPPGSGTGVCHMSNTALPPGGYQLTAGYSGDSNYGASQTGAAQALVIGVDQTATTVTLPAPTLSVSQEGGAQLSYQINPVAATPGVNPTGTVTFSTGSTVLCSSQVNGTTGSCALATAALPLGTYPVTATYTGDANFGASTSDAQTLTIAKDKATASLTLSATKATFGSEQSERFTVNVTGQTSAVPTGKVTVKSGTTTVCSFTLASGHGSCALTATALRPGTYHLTATYGGDANYRGFTSAAKTLTVAKEPTTSTLTLSSATVKVGNEGTEHLSVQVKPKFSGTPTGKVTIKAGATSVCVITLKGGKGTCTLTARQLAAGTYHLTAGYSGTASFAVSTSTSKTLTVTS
jgi:hypothetical protein